MPEEAYGMLNPQALFTIEVEQNSGSEILQTDDRVYLFNILNILDYIEQKIQ